MEDDDRTDEEILADRLAAELEAEFADHPKAAKKPAAGTADAKGGGAAQPVGATGPAASSGLSLEEKKRLSAARADQAVAVSPEALRQAKAEAKGATEGDADKALGALAAESSTRYTRHPIVSVMGHVDHGKTSILDRIRGTRVFEREAGAITQHIGASEVPMDTIYERCGALLKGKPFGVPGLLCIDTPGHHAFTSLRSRGGQLADIAVLVVDIMEGFKPQTLESLNILRRSKTPFVVAANKVDRIHGWKSAPGGPFVLNVRNQAPQVLAAFDDRFYTLIAQFFDQKVPAERYDRITDFRKQVAIVPTCAATGEGIPDLLAMLVGLAQKFLEQRLETDEELPGAGTVLEVKEDKGLGTTLDIVLYAGSISSGDTIMLGTMDEPITTTIRALLKPAPNDDMRDARQDYRPVDHVVAAAGIKLVAPNVDGVVSGAPLRVLRGNEEEAEEEVRAATRVHVPLEDRGIHVKADTIGSLEALAGELKELKIPIRTAAVGPVSRRDVVEAAATPDPLLRAILGFNVPMLPDVEREAAERALPVFTDKVIYSLVEEYSAWRKKTQADLEKAQRQERVHPAKIRFLPGCSFRQRDPAVFGVRVLAGQLHPGRALVRLDGKSIGRIRSIQKENQAVQVAKLGDEVAISVHGPTLGRQIKEEDILYMDIPEGDAKWLLTQGKLTPEERDVLMEFVKTKRKEERFWAM